jgi:dihydropteroate synthase
VPVFWKTKRLSLDLSSKAAIMAILNMTPDSFSDGGIHTDSQTALAHARTMIRDGADIIDVGGESTRPGAPAVTADEEIQRTCGIIARIRAEWDGVISIDTSKAAVAAAALDAGADVVNDVTGLRGDPAMPDLCRTRQCGVVVMHMLGTPQTMQNAPHYDDVVANVGAFFRERRHSLTEFGIARDALVFDPGIGFGKTLEHNLALLRSLDRIDTAGRPLLLGVSRKSFIGAVLGDPDPALRDWPTLAVTAYAREHGVMLHRVHDVRRNREALRMVEAILNH